MYWLLLFYLSGAVCAPARWIPPDWRASRHLHLWGECCVRPTQSDWFCLLFGQFLLWVWSGRNRCLADRSFDCCNITIVFIFSISEPPDGAHYKKPTHISGSVAEVEDTGAPTIILSASVDIATTDEAVHSVENLNGELCECTVSWSMLRWRDALYSQWNLFWVELLSNRFTWNKTRLYWFLWMYCEKLFLSFELCYLLV